MNNDHADAVRLYATKLLGAEDGAWRLTGLDPDGLDLALGDATLRLPFAERVTNAEGLRKVVVALAAAARSDIGLSPTRPWRREPFCIAARNAMHTSLVRVAMGSALAHAKMMI